jgi:hypothetical protein
VCIAAPVRLTSTSILAKGGAMIKQPISPNEPQAGFDDLTQWKLDLIQQIRERSFTMSIYADPSLGEPGLVEPDPGVVACW